MNIIQQLENYLDYLKTSVERSVTDTANPLPIRLIRGDKLYVISEINYTPGAHGFNIIGYRNDCKEIWYDSKRSIIDFVNTSFLSWPY